MNKTDLVITIDYFGFDLNNKINKKIKEKGAILVQDSTQALLSTFDRPFADFIVFSPRKTIGVPNGAIIVQNSRMKLNASLCEEIPSNSLKYIYDAYLKRSIFDCNGNMEWFSEYKLAEEHQLIGSYRIDDLSKSLLYKD